jgi:hypothetical protein
LNVPNGSAGSEEPRQRKPRVVPLGQRKSFSLQ